MVSASSPWTGYRPTPALAVMQTGCPPDVIGLRHRLDQYLSHPGHIVDIAERPQRDDEFVTAHARHGVRFPCQAREPGADLLHEQVPSAVAECIVHLFKPVQIQHEDSYPAPIPAAPAQALTYPVLQQGSIRKSR